MVRWPASDRMSKTSAVVVEKFKKTGAAKELEQDAREWVLVNWPWMPEPPYTIVVRASDGEERRCVMGEDGLWTMGASDHSTHPSAA
ncbi:MAG: hypothetical protein ACLQVI_15495 [Polyangiaceae bacterium]|jgi:hypothetical protein